MLSTEDRIEKIKKAFDSDSFDIDTHEILDGMIGIMAKHKSAVDYDTKFSKKAYYLEGSHYQMGYLLGLLAEGDISSMCTDFVKKFPGYFINHDQNPNSNILLDIMNDAIEAVVDINLGNNPDIPEELRDEFRGMYEGCLKKNPQTKVNPRNIMKLNIGFDVLISLVYTGELLQDKLKEKNPSAKKLKPEHLKIPIMCNGFALFGESVSKKNGFYFGRDFMFIDAAIFQNLACMIIYNPMQEGSYPMVSMTAPGMVGSITGMNSAGIAAGVDMCPSGNCSPHNLGINSLLMVRYIIQYGGSAKEAVNMMACLPRGVSWNYIIADGPNKRACIAEAGTSERCNCLDFPPEDAQKYLPDENFINNHKSAFKRNGLFVRWDDYEYPESYLSFNEGLWKYYNEKFKINKVFNPAAFGKKGYIDNNLSDKNCPGPFYFAPLRGVRKGFIIVTNHYIIPEMRLFAMKPWTNWVVSSIFREYDDIQWRYDRLNDVISSFLKRRKANYKAAKAFLDFLSPPSSDYYSGNPKSKDGKEIRMEGSSSLCDLKAKTIESHYGYFCDDWVRLSLESYL